MKKFLIMSVIGFAMISSFASSMDRTIYLEQLLSEPAANSRSITRDDIGTRAGLTSNEGFAVTFSEIFINTILKQKVSDEFIKDIKLYFRQDKYVIDGIIYFEMLELDIPFTVTGKVTVPAKNVISLDVKEMKVWSEGSLPTDKILSKVVKYLNNNRTLNDYLTLSYETVANRYENFGRIKLAPKLKEMLPSLPDIGISGVSTANEEIIIKGK
ncbi:MAG: hypothetical protein M0R46_16780 [Candidatus Muirbacterium halophilum]|nr:hypothetical protein [Candidatus Muirbacterium halophilum]MCK9477572.1 hypothetical protein [Candidatus Muirbacterium halophilum]